VAVVAGERAGVVLVDRGRLALVERVRDGRRYWVVPGGGVEPGETVRQAAQREAEEELGVAVRLGDLRVRIDHREDDGSFQRQWYFDASVESDGIAMRGPELETVGRGTYRTVWVALDRIDPATVLPSAVARLVVANGGVWPDDVVEIDERPPPVRDPRRRE
jgi:8-oxo-dGTP diphosphatase